MFFSLDNDPHSALLRVFRARRRPAPTPSDLEDARKAAAATQAKPRGAANAPTRAPRGATNEGPIDVDRDRGGRDERHGATCARGGGWPRQLRRAPAQANA